MQFVRYSSSKRNINDLFKSSMSLIANQAMILTAGVPMDENDALHGSTLSSVSSLSVYPSLLQFNLHLPSYTSSTLHENNLVAIHLMKPTSKASEIARIFAKGVKRNDGTMISQGENRDGEIFHEMTTPFHDISEKDWRFKKYGDDFKVPILNDSERIFICKKFRVMYVENHEIWVVKVLDIIINTKNETGGLLYFDRRFHKIGGPVEG